MRRADLLGHFRYAGYHEDARTFVRLMVENRIRRTVAEAEYRKGQEMREAGEPCSCFDCWQRPTAKQRGEE